MERQYDTPAVDPDPQITAVLCTYNRADRVEGAVRAILAQEGCDFELVVVDDGSADATPAVLAAIEDDRLSVVRRPNGGLSAARNSGVAAARGRWIVFIDDDDLAEPGWLRTFLEHTTDPDVGIVCCGATYVNAAGDVLWEHRPAPFGEPYGAIVGSWLAGTFAARTDLVREAGGYLGGLGTRHQSELFIRLLAVADRTGLRLTSVDVLRVRIEARTATDRPGVNPRRLYDGTRWILARHPSTFSGQRDAIARFEGIAATNAARLGEWRAARRRFLRSARATPRSAQRWGRLALVAVPAAGRRVWNRHGEWSTHDAGEVGVLNQVSANGHTGTSELFLAWEYRENPATPDSPRAATTAFRPVAPTDGPALDPASRLVARLARRRGWGPLVEAAHGSAGETPGPGDPPGGGTGSVTAGVRPGLTLCIGLLERTDDPVALLRRLADNAGGGPVLLVTPDRSVSDPDRAAGPPTDARHRREWSYDQLELLLLSTGFSVERSWHVASGTVSGGRLGRAVAAGPLRWAWPGRRPSMVVLARSRTTTAGA